MTYQLAVVYMSHSGRTFKLIASRINIGNMKESRKLKRGESHDDEMKQLRCLPGWFPINIVDVMVDFPRFACAVESVHTALVILPP